MVKAHQTSKKSAGPQSKIEVKKGDFIELDFVGKIKATGQIFDLTVEEIVKKEKLPSRGKLEPMVACVGAGHLLSGFDTQVIGKEIGKEFEFDLAAKDAFGVKDQKLIQLTSLKTLQSKGVNPVPGMQLNADGSTATVRSVSGGRVIMDFNHPLAGRELHYWVKINKLVTDKEKQINSIIKMLGIKCDVEIKDTTATLKIDKALPPPIKDVIQKEIEKHISGMTIKVAA